MARSHKPRNQPNRRDFLKRAAAATIAAALPLPAIAQKGGGRVVVVGGGFAGATCARTLKRIDPRTTVTLVEPSQIFTACTRQPISMCFRSSKNRLVRSNFRWAFLRRLQTRHLCYQLISAY